MNKKINYRVVFDGDLLPGNQRSEVQRRLAGLFKIQEEIVRPFFSGQTRNIKKGISLDNAKSYIKVMARLGALAYIMPQTESITVPKPREKVLSVNGYNERDDTTVPADIMGSLTSNAFSSFFENKKNSLQDAHYEADDAHEICMEEFDKSEDSEITDIGNVINMRKLASMAIHK